MQQATGSELKIGEDEDHLPQAEHSMAQHEATWRPLRPAPPSYHGQVATMSKVTGEVLREGIAGACRRGALAWPLASLQEPRGTFWLDATAVQQPWERLPVHAFAVAL